MHSLRIVSLNTFGAPVLSKNIAKRFRLIADILSAENADVICLQEVVLSPHLRLLAKLFTGYHVAYKRFLYGPKGGLVIFSRIPFEETSFRDFTSLGTVKNKSIVGKIMRYGVLSIRLKNIPITILTTHLTPNSDVEYTEENRFTKFQSSQLLQIARIIHHETLWKRDIILAGDLNIPSGSFLYEEFLRSSGLHDLFSGSTEPTYHNNFLSDGKEQGRIDYIFYSDRHLKLYSSDARYILEHPLQQDGETFYLSDHIGLQAQLQIPENTMEHGRVN